VAQFELLKMLVGPQKNLFAVGDDDQAIYRFRGASFASFRLFADKYPNYQKIKLVQNYRSTKSIIKASGRLIAENKGRFDPGKELWTANEKGFPVQILVSEDFSDEAQVIVQEIKKLKEEGNTYGDIAVLYRAHDYKKEIVKALEKEGIPLTVRGALELTARPEIRDLLAYLHLMVDPNDPVMFYRVLTSPRWNLDPADFKKWVDFLKAKAGDEHSRDLRLFQSLMQIEEVTALSEEAKVKLKAFHDHLEKLIRKAMTQDVDIVFKEIWEEYLDSLLAGSLDQVDQKENHIEALYQFIQAYSVEHPRERTVAEFIDYWKAFTTSGGDIPFEQDVKEGVQLMTIHAAKGLEFPIVFIPSVNERRFPSQLRKETIPIPSDLLKEEIEMDRQMIHEQEERRLLYVAMTRARERLYLTGIQRQRYKLSRFMDEVLRESESAVKQMAEHFIQIAEPEHPITRTDQIYQELRSLLLADIQELTNLEVHHPRVEELLESILRRFVETKSLIIVSDENNSKKAKEDLFSWMKEWHQKMYRVQKELNVELEKNETDRILEALAPEVERGGRLPKPYRFSFSQIALYLRNPVAYKIKYIYGISGLSEEKKGWGTAAILGTLVHKVLELFYTSLKEGQKPSWKLMIQHFHQTWNPREFVDPELASKKRQEAEKMLRDFYNLNEGKFHIPEALEKGFSLKIDGEEIFGFIDKLDMFEDGKIELTDYKSGEDEGLTEEYRLQLLIYALWAQEHYQKKPEELILTLYNVRSGKKYSFVSTQEDLDWARKILRNAISGIKADRFTPIDVSEDMSSVRLELERKIEEVRQKKDLQSQATLFAQLSLIYQEQGETDKYREALKKALDLFVKQIQTKDVRKNKSAIRRLVKETRDLGFDQGSLRSSETIFQIGKLKIKLGRGFDSSKRYRWIRTRVGKIILTDGENILHIEKGWTKGLDSRSILQVGETVFQLIDEGGFIDLSSFASHPEFWSREYIQFFGRFFVQKQLRSRKNAERAPPLVLLKDYPHIVFKNKTAEEIQESLDEKQLQALTHQEGPLAVVGGPGSGKTEVLIRRASYLLHTVKDLKPRGIWIFAPHRDLQRKIQSKLIENLGPEGMEIPVLNPKSLARKILKEENRELKVISDVEERLILREVFSQLNLTYYRPIADYPDLVGNVLGFIHQLKESGVRLEDYRQHVEEIRKEAGEDDNRRQEDVLKIFEAFENELQKRRLLGWSDLTFWATEAIKKKPQISKSYQERMKFVMIDQVSDLSQSDQKFLKMFFGFEEPEKQINIWMTSDGGKQNFSWGEWPRVILEGQYRLVRQIGDLFSQMKHENRSFQKIRPLEERELERNVHTILGEDESDISEAVAREIKTRYEALSPEERAWDQFVILLRFSKPTTELLKALRAKGIPYDITKETNLLETDEIRMLIDMLRAIHGENDYGGALKLMSHERWSFSSETIGRIVKFMRRHELSLKDALIRKDQIVDFSPQESESLSKLEGLLFGYTDSVKQSALSTLRKLMRDLKVIDVLAVKGTLDADQKALNIGRFFRFVIDFVRSHPRDESLGNFLRYLELFDREGGDPGQVILEGKTPGVQILPAHRSRGLEFPHVFLIWNPGEAQEPLLIEDDFPLPPALLRGKNLVQNRLQREEDAFLTGLTRASQNLFLVGQKEDLPRLMKEAVGVLGQNADPIVLGKSKRGLPSEWFYLKKELKSKALKALESPNADLALKEFMEHVLKLVLVGTAQRSKYKEVDQQIQNAKQILDRWSAEKLRQGFALGNLEKARDEVIRFLQIPVEILKRIPLPSPLKFSYSGIEKFQECPFIYRFHYVLSIPDRGSGATSFGSYIHKNLEDLFTLLNQGKKPSLEAVMQDYEKHWPAEGYEDKLQEEVYRKLGRTILADYYRNQIEGVTFSPGSFELERSFEFKIGPHIVRGKIDRIEFKKADDKTGIKEVLDLKTGKPKTQRDVDKSLQLSIYAYAIDKDFGNLPDTVSFFSLTSGEKVSSQRTKEDLREVEETVKEIAEKVLGQEFEPKPGFHCNFCTYKPICPAHETPYLQLRLKRNIPILVEGKGSGVSVVRLDVDNHGDVHLGEVTREDVLEPYQTNLLSILKKALSNLEKEGLKITGKIHLVADSERPIGIDLSDETIEVDIRSLEHSELLEFGLQHEEHHKKIKRMPAAIEELIVILSDLLYLERKSDQEVFIKNLFSSMRALERAPPGERYSDLIKQLVPLNFPQRFKKIIDYFKNTADFRHYAAALEILNVELVFDAHHAREQIPEELFHFNDVKETIQNLYEESLAAFMRMTDALLSGAKEEQKWEAIYFLVLLGDPKGIEYINRRAKDERSVPYVLSVHAKDFQEIESSVSKIGKDQSVLLVGRSENVEWAYSKLIKAHPHLSQSLYIIPKLNEIGPLIDRERLIQTGKRWGLKKALDWIRYKWSALWVGNTQSGNAKVVLDEVLDDIFKEFRMAGDEVPIVQDPFEEVKQGSFELIWDPNASPAVKKGGNQKVIERALNFIKRKDPTLANILFQTRIHLFTPPEDLRRRLINEFDIYRSAFIHLKTLNDIYIDKDFWSALLSNRPYRTLAVAGVLARMARRIEYLRSSGVDSKEISLSQRKGEKEENQISKGIGYRAFDRFIENRMIRERSKFLVELLLNRGLSPKEIFEKMDHKNQEDFSHFTRPYLGLSKVKSLVNLILDKNFAVNEEILAETIQNLRELLWQMVEFKILRTQEQGHHGLERMIVTQHLNLIGLVKLIKDLLEFKERKDLSDEDYHQAKERLMIFNHTLADIRTQTHYVNDLNANLNKLYKGGAYISGFRTGEYGEGIYTIQIERQLGAEQVIQTIGQFTQLELTFVGFMDDHPTWRSFGRHEQEGDIFIIEGRLRDRPSVDRKLKSHRRALEQSFKQRFLPPIEIRELRDIIRNAPIVKPIYLGLLRMLINPETDAQVFSTDLTEIIHRMVETLNKLSMEREFRNHEILLRARTMLQTILDHRNQGFEMLDFEKGLLGQALHEFFISAEKAELHHHISGSMPPELIFRLYWKYPAGRREFVKFWFKQDFSQEEADKVFANQIGGPQNEEDLKNWFSRSAGLEVSDPEYRDELIQFLGGQKGYIESVEKMKPFVEYRPEGRGGDLQTYLDKLTTGEILLRQDPQAARIAVREVAMISFKDGVKLLEMRSSGARPGSSLTLKEQVQPVVEGLMDAEKESDRLLQTGLIIVFRKEPEAILGKLKVEQIIKEADQLSLEEAWERIKDSSDRDELKKQMQEAKIKEEPRMILMLIYARDEMLKRMNALVDLKNKWSKEEPEFAKHLIGIDTAGNEKSYLNWTHIPALKLAVVHGFQVTTHVGEAWDEGDIRGALLRMKRDIKTGTVSRIGHGTAIGILPQDLTYSHDEIREIKKLQIEVTNEIVKRGITVETNPTSNVLLSEGIIPDYARHPVQFLYRKGVPVAVSQDNSWILHTRGLSAEFVRIWFAHNFKFSDILSLIEQGFRGSFLNASKEIIPHHQVSERPEIRDERKFFEQAA
jgi:superfamily I DNA/RNA helicase/adenosine deaminase/RecB family exonuclease